MDLYWIRSGSRSSMVCVSSTDPLQTVYRRTSLGKECSTISFDVEGGGLRDPDGTRVERSVILREKLGGILQKIRVFFGSYDKYPLIQGDKIYCYRQVGQVRVFSS